MIYFTAAFLRGAIERAIKTAAQVGAAYIGAVGFIDGSTVSGVLEVQWAQLLAVVAMGAIASLFTSFSSPEVVAAPYVEPLKLPALKTDSTTVHPFASLLKESEGKHRKED